jgi:predicted small lipoprotein YifL
VKRRRPFLLALCAAGIALALGAQAGCGQRGPLKLPTKPAPAAAKAEAAATAPAPATK